MLHDNFQSPSQPQCYNGEHSPQQPWSAPVPMRTIQPCVHISEEITRKGQKEGPLRSVTAQGSNGILVILVLWS